MGAGSSRRVGADQPPAFSDNPPPRQAPALREILVEASWGFSQHRDERHDDGPLISGFSHKKLREWRLHARGLGKVEAWVDVTRPGLFPKIISNRVPDPDRVAFTPRFGSDAVHVHYTTVASVRPDGSETDVAPPLASAAQRAPQGLTPLAMPHVYDYSGQEGVDWADASGPYGLRLYFTPYNARGRIVPGSVMTLAVRDPRDGRLATQMRCGRRGRKGSYWVEVQTMYSYRDDDAQGDSYADGSPVRNDGFVFLCLKPHPTRGWRRWRQAGRKHQQHAFVWPQKARADALDDPAFQEAIEKVSVGVEFRMALSGANFAEQARPNRHTARIGPRLTCGTAARATWQMVVLLKEWRAHYAYKATELEEKIRAYEEAKVKTEGEVAQLVQDNKPGVDSPILRAELQELTGLAEHCATEIQAGEAQRLKLHANQLENAEQLEHWQRKQQTAWQHLVGALAQDGPRALMPLASERFQPSVELSDADLYALARRAGGVWSGVVASWVRQQGGTPPSRRELSEHVARKLLADQAAPHLKRDDAPTCDRKETQTIKCYRGQLNRVFGDRPELLNPVLVATFSPATARRHLFSAGGEEEEDDEPPPPAYERAEYRGYEPPPAYETLDEEEQEQQHEQQQLELQEGGGGDELAIVAATRRDSDVQPMTPPPGDGNDDEPVVTRAVDPATDAATRDPLRSPRILFPRRRRSSHGDGSAWVALAAHNGRRGSAGPNDADEQVHDGRSPVTSRSPVARLPHAPHTPRESAVRPMTPPLGEDADDAVIVSRVVGPPDNEDSAE